MSVPKAPRLSRKQRKNLKLLLVHLLLIAGALVMLFPFAWLVSSTLKPMNEIFAVPIRWIPTTITLENYINGWNGLPGYTFSTFFLNSC